MESLPSQKSFPVLYQNFTGSQNPDLRGKGLLIISDVEPRFQFTGETRTFFGKPTTIQFASDQIWNVTLENECVGFSTRVGVSGERDRPFVFYLPTPAVAAEVAQALPSFKHGDFVVGRDFQQKLHALRSDGSAWTSATNLLIGANVVAFIVMGFLGAGWFEPAAMKPYVYYVANNGGATTDGEWWRIVSSMFVHYGAMHLLLNMWALFQTGHFVERLFGRVIFTAGYFGSGIVASFTSLFWHGDKIWSAGASGAVFGVYGLLLGFMLRERQSIPSPVLRPLLKSTLIFAGYNLFYGMIHPKIDNAAHIGGLVGGLAFGFLMALPVDAEIHKKSSSARLRLGLGVLAVFVAVAIPLSPRYDYNFRDELKWQEANRQSAEEEESLLKRQEKAVADLGKTANSSEQLVSLVEDTMIPFYENWRARLAALTLTPGKLTQTRREKLIRLLDAKLTNYRELASGLRRNDMSAVSHYAEAEDRAMAPLKAKPQ